MQITVSAAWYFQQKISQSIGRVCFQQISNKFFYKHRWNNLIVALIVSVIMINIFTIFFFIKMILFIFLLNSDNFDAIDARIQILSQECVEDLTSQGFKE